MSDNDTLHLPDLDESLARRLLEHRTLVLGSVLDERLGNRLCQGLLLLAAEDPTTTSSSDQLPRRLGARHARHPRLMRTIPNDVVTV